jgi:hypothetical protein
MPDEEMPEEERELNDEVSGGQLDDSIKEVEDAQKNVEDASDAERDKLSNALRKSYENLSKRISVKLSKGKITDANMTEAMNKIGEIMKGDGNIAEKIKELNDNYGTEVDALDSLNKSTSGLVRRMIVKTTGNIFDSVSESNKAALNDSINNAKELYEGAKKSGGGPRESGELTSALEKLKTELNESLKDIKRDNPTAEEKGKSTYGEKAWELFKALALLGALVGAVFLVGSLLSNKYSGCYQYQTGQDSFKLEGCDYGGDNKKYCSCGGEADAPNDQSSSKELCTKSPALQKYPFCMCNPYEHKFCGSDLSKDGAISYMYDEVGPFEAIARGVTELVKEVANDVGINDILKYLKYIIFGVLGIFLLYFLVFIGMKVFKSSSEESSGK